VIIWWTSLSVALAEVPTAAPAQGLELVDLVDVTSWHILMKGSIVQAGEGDRDAAKRAKSIGRLLIDQYR
jgi:hypothetical protein